MAAGQVIGRVSVKVLPDTTDFRRDAEKALDKIEKTLKISIPTKIDMSGASREMLEEVRKINQRNRTMDSRKIRFHAMFSRDGMVEEVRRAVRALQDKAKSEKIKFDVDVAATIISGELDKESLKHVKHELENWRDDVSPLEVNIKPSLMIGSTTFIAARLEHLTRPRTVPIIPVLKGGATRQVATTLAALSGARVLHNVFDELWDSMKNLDKAVPKIAALANGILGLGGYALAASSNLFALSASLAQIGGAGLALPGILGGIAIGLGASIAVLKDFNKVIPEVAGMFHTLQDAMSSKFWTVAEKPLRKMIDSLFPEFASSIKQTATELGGFFAAFAASLDGKLKPILSSMFDDLNKSILIATGSADAFAGIIATLGKVGAGMLPRLATWFGKIATQFDGWLTKAQNDGRLQQWINDGVDALKDLGRVLSGVGSILSGVAHAAKLAGGTTLGPLADSLERVAAIVNGPTFQSSLVDVLKAAHTAMERIADKAGPAMTKFFEKLSQTLTTVLPLVGDTLGTALDAVATALSNASLHTGFIEMLVGIQSGVEALAPHLPKIAEALGAVMKVVGKLAEKLGPILGAAFDAVADAIIGLEPKIQPVIDFLSDQLLKVIDDNADSVDELAIAFAAFKIGSFLINIGKATAALVTNTIAWVANATAAAISMAETMFIMGLYAAAAVASAATTVAAWLVSTAQTIALMAMYAASAIASAATATAAWVASAARTVASLVATGAAFVAQGVVMVASMAATVASVVAGWVLMAAQAMAAAVRMAAAWLIAMGPIGWIILAVVALVALIVVYWGDIKKATVKAWNFVIDFLVDTWKEAVRECKVAWQWIKDAVSGSWQWIKDKTIAVWNAIKSWLSGAWEAVKSKATSVWEAIKAGLSAAWEAIKSKTTQTWEAIKSGLAAAWNAIKTKVIEGIATLVTKVAAIPGKIKNSIGNAKTLLLNTGEDVVKGLISGIGNMLQAAKDAIGHVVSGVIDFAKGKAGFDTHSPSKVFTEIGKFVGQGLAKGIAGTRSEVNAKMSELVALVIKTGDQGMIELVKNTRKRLNELAGEYDKLSDRMTKYVADLKALRDEANGYQASIFDSIAATGNVTSFEDSSFAGIVSGMKDARRQAREFATALDQLAALGLSATAMGDIAAAGPASGLAAAQSLVEAGKAGIREVNELQKQIDKAALKSAKIARDAMYESGINIAQGLVNGLQNQMDPIKAQMRSIAQAMVRELKKELGIKSPSRVFRNLGSFVGKGFTLGIEDEAHSVESALSRMTDVGARRVSNLSGAIDTNLSTDGTVVKQFVYNAAEGSSINSEEDLFAATQRSRMVDW